jgi:hypothetical protein
MNLIAAAKIKNNLLDHQQKQPNSQSNQHLQNYFPEKLKNRGKISAIFIKSEEKFPRF